MAVNKVQTTNDISDEQALIRSLDQLADEAKSVAEGVERIDAQNLTTNPVQPAVTDISNTLTTISGTYVQAEIDSLSASIKTVSDKLDLVLATLRSSNILGE